MCSSSVCVLMRGFYRHWPRTRFSRLRAVTGLKPRCPQTILPIISYYKQHPKLLSLSCSVPVFLPSHTHPHSFFFPSLSSSEIFHGIFASSYGPLRITSGHQFGVISTIWTMKLLHLRVYAKILSQEVLLVCRECSTRCWV